MELHPLTSNWIRGRRGRVFIPIISTKGINQIKKGKKLSFMYPKRFNTFSKKFVQFRVGAIPINI